MAGSPRARTLAITVPVVVPGPTAEHDEQADESPKPKKVVLTDASGTGLADPLLAGHDAAPSDAPRHDAPLAAPTLEVKVVDPQAQAQAAALAEAEARAAAEAAKAEYLRDVAQRLEDENDLALRTFLAGRSVDQRRVDLNTAIAQLQTNVDATRDEKHASHASHAEFTRLLAGVQAAQAKAPEADYPMLTEFTHRAALRAMTPDHARNNRRFPVVTEEVSKRSWGKLIGGIALAVLGAALLAAAIACAIASGGASAPVSGVLGWVAKAMITTGLAASTATTGAAIITTAGVAAVTVAGVAGTAGVVGGTYLAATSGSKYSLATNPARTMYAPKPVAPTAPAVVTVADAVDNRPRTPTRTA